MIESSFSIKNLLRAIRSNIRFCRNFVITAPDTGSILRFTSNNFVTKFRYDTFFFKEPETLEWIDKMEDGATLWDVGANVGLYTIYFLMQKKNGNVVAFEPHPSNLVCLADNLYGNDLLNGRATIVANPIYSENSICNFNMSSNAIGDSNHTVSRKVSSLYFKTPTITLETLLSSGLSCPDYLKIDVDGNERDIIKSADLILSNQKLKSVLIELDIADRDETSFIVGRLDHFGFKETGRFDAMAKFNKVSHKKLHNIIFDRL